MQCDRKPGIWPYRVDFCKHLETEFGSRRYCRCFAVGLAEELKMSREETRARVSALHARDAIMELLLGAERVTASEKQRILAVAVVWDAPLLTQEIETRKRINLINELLREVILPRADSEVVRALDAIEDDR